jgi:hypothetical protein
MLAVVAFSNDWMPECSRHNERVNALKRYPVTTTLASLGAVNDTGSHDSHSGAESGFGIGGGGGVFGEYAY